MGNSSTTPEHKYTWTRDIPSKHDKMMKFSSKASESCIINLRDPYTTSISTTTDAVSLVFEHTLDVNEISRTFLYWHSRDESLKTSISKTLRSLQKNGWVKAKSWPNTLNYIDYEPKNLEVNKINLKIRKIKRTAIKGAINEGYPIIFGFTVYNDDMNFPKDSDYLLGGLAGVIYGYDDNTFNVRTNGENKVFEKTYIMDDDLSFDFWIMYSEGKPLAVKKYTIVNDSSDEDEEL
jgi:hypothetical protein